MSERAFVVALLGAESTGKTTLASEIAAALAAEGVQATVVPEFLREFCDARGRTPRHDEQAAIAAEQTRRIEAAAARGTAAARVDSRVADRIVVADTTALMVAVYSDHVFGDSSLYAEAEAAQRRTDLTLLAALDLPWRLDGLQRDGAHVQPAVDALVRASLRRAGVPFVTVAGNGEARLTAALDALRAVRPQGPAA